MNAITKCCLAITLAAILLNLVSLATRVRQPVIIECQTQEQPVGNIIQRRHNALTNL